MKRIWVMIVMLLLGVSVIYAQDTEITLTPVRDSTFHLSGVAPEGWINMTQGVYRRGANDSDMTLFVMQSAPMKPDQLLEVLLPSLQLQEAPKPVGTIKSETLTWTVYKVDVAAGSVTVSVDIGLAENEGTTYVIILQTAQDEYEALHKAVFLPAVDALRVVVPVKETLPYKSEDVTFKNGDTTLAGTLTLPEGEGPFAAVVLVSGSGPQDRDETIGGMKPLGLVADGLTRAGMAVLRYDDQGMGDSSGDIYATIDETITNAAAAVDYLTTRKEIKTDQIGILGHSEGGYVAASLAAHNPKVAFIIAMAGPAVSGKALLIEQNKRILKAEGASDEAIKIQVDVMPKMWDALEKNDRSTFFDLVKQNSIAYIKALPEDQQKTIGDIEAYAKTLAEQQVSGYFNRWFKSFLAVDPTPDWEKTTIPVLAIYGGNDIQVPADQSIPPLETALKKAGNKDYKVVTLPDANHLFQKASTGAISEYSTLDPVLTPDLIPAMVDWLKTHVTLSAG
jgi:pimeloyl-ACP methyl ester carboxylesterase